ncbi:hypothetical protein EJB05_31461, partial [Eragrostis curvula]
GRDRRGTERGETDLRPWSNAVVVTRSGPSKDPWLRGNQGAHPVNNPKLLCVVKQANIQCQIFQR